MCANKQFLPQRGEKMALLEGYSLLMFGAILVTAIILLSLDKNEHGALRLFLIFALCLHTIIFFFSAYSMANFSLLEENQDTYFSKLQNNAHFSYYISIISFIMLAIYFIVYFIYKGFSIIKFEKEERMRKL